MALRSPKQRLFVKEYLIDHNATQAAIRAGYSSKTAYSIGQENLKKPEIWAELKKAMTEREEKTQVTAEMVIKGLLKEATREDDQGTPAARVSAWEKLGKHLGIFEKDNSQKSGPQVILVGKFGADEELG